MTTPTEALRLAREALTAMMSGSKRSAIAVPPDGHIWNGWGEKAVPTDAALDKAAATLAAIDALAQQPSAPSAPSAEPADLIAGALYDLMGYLTTRDETIRLGATELATPAADAVVAFAGMRGLSLDNPAIRDWSKSIAAPLMANGLTEAETAATASMAGLSEPAGWVHPGELQALKQGATYAHIYATKRPGASQAVYAALAAAQPPAAMPVPALLLDDQCDLLVAKVMDKIAEKASAQQGRTVDPAELNPSITEHHALRRSIVQAAYMLAASPAAQPVPATGAQPKGVTADLSAQMMNLRCVIPGTLPLNEHRAYRMGHRDARHAAAEVAAHTGSAAE